MKTLKIAVVATLLGVAGFASAQTVPALTLSITAPASVVTGSDQPVATIRMTGGAEGVTLTSLPVSVGYSGTQGATAFTGCALRSGSATAAALNTGSNEVGVAGTGKMNLRFDQPFAVAANSTADLVLTCDIPALTPDGSAIATAIDVNEVMATSTAGVAVAVRGVGPTGPNGEPGGVVAVTSVTPGTPTIPDTGTPGVPNTGAGGLAGAALMTLVLSGLVALAGIVYLLRPRHA